MDNLVDIDALLGDLELESETSNGHVPVANLPLSQPAATNGHNLTLPSAVTSNGFTNSTNGGKLHREQYFWTSLYSNINIKYANYIE